MKLADRPLEDLVRHRGQLARALALDESRAILDEALVERTRARLVELDDEIRLRRRALFADDFGLGARGRTQPC